MSRRWLGGRQPLDACCLLLPLFATLLTFAAAQSCTDSRARPGRCVAVGACSGLLQEYYSGGAGASSALLGADFSTYMGASICGFDGANFLICCPQRTAAINGARPPVYQPLPATSAAATSAPPNFALHFISLNALGSATASPWNPWATQRPGWPPPPPVTLNPSPIVFQPTFAVPTRAPAPLPPAPLPPPVAPAPAGSCGVIQGTINRVVGGAEARRGSYPWMAALAYNEAAGVQFLCAGSLIAPAYVATSAHCINARLLHVRVGAHNLGVAAETGALDVRIKRAVAHEQFDARTLANDIALIELAQALPATALISPICLPEGEAFLASDFLGSNPFVAGWGATRFQGSTSPVLRDAQVPIVQRQVCEQSYRSVFSFVQFSEKFICAGNSNVDACQGDSGGPLMMPQLDSSGAYRFYLLGIVSYGYECARPGFPGVYTRVASFLPWLRARMT